MKIQHISGMTGFGDLVRTISYALSTLTEPTHLIFHYSRARPIDHTIDQLIPLFQQPQYQYTYEVRLHDRQQLIDIRENTDDLIRLETSLTLPHKYHPFKTQWIPNTDGPIALYLTHKMYRGHGSDSIRKFFNSHALRRINQIAQSNPQLYPILGLPLTVQQSVDIMSRSRYVVGIEGGWTHIAACMNVPYIAVRNMWDADTIMAIHEYHPTLEIIETHEMAAALFGEL